jgi:hypothetical protein
MATQPDNLELDTRFPSGEWHGFYIQPSFAKGRRFRMDLCLTFKDGILSGEGRDSVWKFIIKGRYDIKSGEVTFHKHYLGMHSVYYRGFAEGKGIWGVWEISSPRSSYSDKGGFHIWPKGMAEGTGEELAEEAGVPVKEEKVTLVG